MSVLQPPAIVGQKNGHALIKGIFLRALCPQIWNTANWFASISKQFHFTESSKDEFVRVCVCVCVCLTLLRW